MDLSPYSASSPQPLNGDRRSLPNNQSPPFSENYAMRWSIVDQLWKSYEAHGDVDFLRDDILTSPWYQRPHDVDGSLLNRAVQSHDLPAVSMLLSIGESPSLPAKDGFSLLHSAVDLFPDSSTSTERDEVLRIVEKLLEYGADPNVYGMDGTPLHRAAGNGSVEVARMLLNHGADIEIRMLVDGERTPLIHAALMNEVEMVRFLLSVGASKDTAISRTLTDEATTLQEILRGRGTPVAKEILSLLECNRSQVGD